MQPNTNPETGIRYGIISANSLNLDLLDTLLYAVGTELSFIETKNEVRLNLEREADALEEEVHIAVAEEDYAMLSSESYMERRTLEAYEAAGFLGREDFIETQLEQAMQDYYCEEPETAFEYQGVTGRTTWLGGAMLVWIFNSPHVSTFDLCSPCVPGACNLDSPNPDGYGGYTVPNDWLAAR